MVRCMVVEDERDICELIVYLLTIGGHESIVFRNGREAEVFIEKIDAGEIEKDQQPGLAWLDHLLPGKFGLEVGCRIRQSPQIGKIPILMVAATGGQQNAHEKFLASGCIDYFIHKPWSPDELLRRIEEILAEHAWRHTDE